MAEYLCLELGCVATGDYTCGYCAKRFCASHIDPHVQRSECKVPIPVAEQQWPPLYGPTKAAEAPPRVTAAELRRHNKEECRKLIRDFNDEQTANKSADPVNHPSHYNQGKIEAIEFIEDQKLGFNLGNAIKYIVRAGKKDSNTYVQDLEKARWYIRREIELQKESPCRPNQMN